MSPAGRLKVVEKIITKLQEKESYLHFNNIFERLFFSKNVIVKYVKEYKQPKNEVPVRFVVVIPSIMKPHKNLKFIKDEYKGNFTRALFKDLQDSVKKDKSLSDKLSVLYVNVDSNPYAMKGKDNTDGLNRSNYVLEGEI